MWGMRVERTENFGVGGEVRYRIWSMRTPVNA